MSGMIEETVGGVVVRRWPLAATPADTGVPRTVTMGQAQLALHDAGLLGGVEAAIEAMPEPQRTRARIEWTRRPTVDRDSALVAQLAQAVDLDDAALDALFTTAATL